MTLGLLTITHDEAETLPEMLASVRNLIDGPAIAFHIGEHDETADILTGWGAEVHRRAWEDFDGSWTALFQLARGRADRFLYMQANSTLELDGVVCECGHERSAHQVEDAAPGRCWTGPTGDPGSEGCGCTRWRPTLPLDPDVPCYMIRYRRGPYEYRLPNLLRGDIAWSINAPVHGTLEPSFFNERRNLDTLVVQESDADGRRPEKLARYLPLMEKQVADNPTPRNVFYLARTYFDLGRFEEAVAHYDWRIRLGGWDEEQWHAMYMRGVALIRLARFAEGRAGLMAAYHFRPTRAEPLLAICRSMNPPGDLLFIEQEAYAP